MREFFGLGAEWWTVIVAALAVAGAGLRWLIQRKNRKPQESQALSAGTSSTKQSQVVNVNIKMPSFPADSAKSRTRDPKVGDYVNSGVLLEIGSSEYMKGNYDMAMYYFQVACDLAKRQSGDHGQP